MQKSRVTLTTGVVQIALATSAAIMAAFVHSSVSVIIGLAIVGLSATITRVAAAIPNPLRKECLVAGWVGTLMAFSGPIFSPDAFIFDDYYSLLAGMMTAALSLTVCGETDAALKNRWKKLALTWAFVTVMILLITSCLLCFIPEFYSALLLLIVVLIFCRMQFKLRPAVIMTVNTLILLLIVFPPVDLYLRLRSRMEMRAQPTDYYSYEDARKNPTAYVRWTRYYDEQWNTMGRTVMEPHSETGGPVRLRPNGRGTLFHSLIAINSQGFRGPEIPAEKGNTYRIVALGESTTFGCTLMADDKPWPELLEAMIRDRLKLSRPVEVINAGTPSWDLNDNLARLPRDILPLKPDMIISYHGYNGFYMLNRGILPSLGKPPPRYEKRPLKLLADLEYAIRLASYKKHFVSKLPPPQAPTQDPMKSKYALAYDQLIDITRTHGIRLVLANYSMAVNPGSDPDVIDFYRDTWPFVDNEMRANVAHTKIVKELANEHPEVIPVDTQLGFDGHHDKFIDLVHFTQSGRQHMAETFFAAIRPVLEQDLAPKEPAKP